jgi:two-component system, cell cycle sensor histidine kinase and response regulator CckA
MGESTRILIVEDLPTDAELCEREVMRVLSACEFRRVETREEYLAALTEFGPALIVSDFKLPQFDGLSALKLAVERCPEVPFIIVTGSMNEDTAVECMKAGAWDYVIKEHIKRLGPAVLGALERQRVRQENEAALRDSEDRFRVLFEQAADLILLMEIPPRGTAVIRDANTATFRLLGFERDELIGQPASFINATRDASRLVTEERQHVPSPQRATFEAKHRCKDGTIRDFECSGAVIHIGTRTFAMSVERDITERKRAQHDLAASETRYRRLFEAAKDGILILDAGTGKIVDVNPFLVELTGWSHGELLGKHLWEIGPFKDIAASKASFADLQAKEYVRYEDLPLETHDGRKIDVEFVSNVYRVDSQRVIQCNIRDITERKRAAMAAAERERNYRELFDNAGDAILIADIETGIILDANQAAEALLGRSRHELIGINRSKIHPADKALRHDEEFREHVSLGQVTDAESDVVRKDGTIVPVRISARVVDLEGKKVLQGIFRDVTDSKRAEAEREKLQEQLRMSQKMEAIGSLAGGIAHDFNNLLSVILSYTGFAMKNLRDGDPVRDDLREVQQAGERAAALTRQLLAFSRRQVLQPVPLSLNQIAAGLEKMLRRILGEDIDLVQVLEPDLGVVRADEGQIEQVLMNLVVNARDAMPEGGKLTIETANVDLDDEYAARHVAVKPGPYVQLAVTDTGCGMDEQTKAKVFEPFFTTKEKGKGTGLGLSTVYGIVKQSGGNLWVYSEPGKGTTFKVYLPREPEATATATATATKRRVVHRLARGTETILVVEDEEALRKVAVRTLEAAGYTVLTAGDGFEALLTHAPRVGDIHLLLTDVVMPRMSGRVLAHELLGMQPTLKVLYMSGYTDDAIVHHGVLDAGTHFLSKPFSADDLTQKVREVLDEGITDRADGGLQAVADDSDRQEQRLDQEALRALPPRILAELRQAVVAARYDDIVALVETIRLTEPDVATALQQMVARFDYDGLMNLLGPRKEEPRGG